MACCSRAATISSPPSRRASRATGGWTASPTSPCRIGSPPVPPEFSLQAYADQSFGIYQDDVEDVVLRISAEAADSALRWRFHVAQTVEAQADGGVLVRFRASGMRELAGHLFTWGAEVQVLAPERLRTLLIEALRTALASHETGDPASSGPHPRPPAE